MAICFFTCISTTSFPLYYIKFPIRRVYFFKKKKGYPKVSFGSDLENTELFQCSQNKQSFDYINHKWNKFYILPQFSNSQTNILKPNQLIDINEFRNQDSITRTLNLLLVLQQKTIFIPVMNTISYYKS